MIGNLVYENTNVKTKLVYFKKFLKPFFKQKKTSCLENFFNFDLLL